MSLILDVLFAKKGNSLTSESRAAATLGGAPMDVANQVSRSRQKDHQRAVPRDLTFNTQDHHGQSLLVKSEEDFHDKLLEFQEDGAYMLERTQDNLKSFLRYCHWSKEMIKNYLANGGLDILMQLMLQNFIHFLQHPYHCNLWMGELSWLTHSGFLLWDAFKNPHQQH